LAENQGVKPWQMKGVFGNVSIIAEQQGYFYK
jgi:hypothetical protein